MKVEIRNKAGYSFIVNMDKNTRLYPHFRLFELANNEGDTNIPQMLLTPESDEFMLLVEQLRCWWDKPMNCNSNYRQRAYNKRVGGSSNSLHLEALAFDWPVILTYAQRIAVYNQWMDITRRAGKIGGINFYPWGLHIDANEDKFGYKHFVIRNGKTVVQSVPRP